ncbi:MAG: hypothetical protein D6753_08895 [Planctomycetota bacterium]|nr:MAG: hypothetical protein D6753_08895 [Planctomycetota bacterium]
MDPAWVALVLFFTAIVLVIVDLFVPSGGLLLVLAAISAIACVLFGFRSSPGMGKTMLMLVLAAIPVLAFSAIKIWPRTPIGRRVILRRPPTPSASDSVASVAPWEELIGRVVQAEFPLMPSGEVQIDGRRYPAMAEAGMIERGQRVEVVDVRHRVLIVRPTNKPVSQPVRSESPPQSEGGTLNAERDVERILETPLEEIGLEDLDDDAGADRSA